MVDDAVLGGYEMAVSGDRAGRLGLRQIQYLLTSMATVSEPGPLTLAGNVLQVERVGSQPFLHSGEVVLSQAQVKQRFGEFAQRRDGSDVVPDIEWESANIVHRHLPVIGAVTCHRKVLADLEAAMDEIERAGLADLIDVGDFATSGGCYNPRPVRERDGAMSRHSWGIADAHVRMLLDLALTHVAHSELIHDGPAYPDG